MTDPVNIHEVIRLLQGGKVNGRFWWWARKRLRAKRKECKTTKGD